MTATADTYTMPQAPQQPVLAVVDDADLPPAVRPAAQRWRALDERDTDTADRLGVLAGQRPAADAEDAADLRAAVLAGEPAPAPTHRPDLEQQVTATERELATVRQLKAQAGRTLADALAEHRSELAALAASRIGKAAADYAEALTQAEALTTPPAARLAASTELLGLLGDVDAAAEPLSCAPVPVPRPNLAAARALVADLTATLAGLDVPAPGRIGNRRVRSLLNGIEIVAPTQTAAALVEQGIATYSDGRGDHRLDHVPTPPAAA